MTVRIGFYLDTWHYGGVEISMLDLVRQLDRVRFEPIVFLRTANAVAEREMRKAFHDMDVPVRELDPDGLPLPHAIPPPAGTNGAMHGPPPAEPAADRRFRRRGFGTPGVLWYHARKIWQVSSVFRAERLGVIHFLHPYFPCYEIPILAARLAGIPVRLCDVQTEPMQHAPKTRARRLIAELAVRSATHVRAMSETGAAAIHANCRVPRERVHVITSHVKLERFGLPLPAFRDANARTVMMVARLSPEKGHRVLFDAVDALKERHPDVRYWLVGDGPIREELEREVMARGLSPWIQFLGFRHDVPDLFRKSDIVILPSFFEELPWAILEAMAVGRPVIATPVGAVAEIVQDGTTGRLVPPGSSTELAAALDEFLSCDSSLLQAMGHAGRRRIEERYTHPDLFKAYEAFYRAAPSNGAAGP
jgi:glycosyltransferase involved in cell wall biosynthesis